MELIPKKKDKSEQIYINEYTPIILNNTLNNFIKDENYNNIKNDLIKDDIFNFASFINSCKEYNNLRELKNDIKIFFRNKNENFENQLHIIYNYLTQLSKIISTKEFFNQKDNIQLLLKIIKRFDKNLDTNLSIKHTDYINIQEKIIDKYESILLIFAKNNPYEKINDFIANLTKKNEELKNKLNNINLIVNENDKLNTKLLGKEKKAPIDNNINNDIFLFHPNHKSKKEININKDT